MAGLAGSALVAESTDAIASLASGIEQEMLNAGMLALAVLMLATPAGVPASDLVNEARVRIPLICPVTAMP